MTNTQLLRQFYEKLHKLTCEEDLLLKNENYCNSELARITWEMAYIEERIAELEEEMVNEC